MVVRFTLIRGAVTLLLAAFFWGIGNTITGLTAQEYLASDSLFAAVDIALANTAGGLSFVTILLFIRAMILKTPASKSDSRESLRLRHYYRNKHSLLAGALKGANTSLFVLSTTYIVATQSLVFESIYIFWSLLLGIVFFTRKIPSVSTVLKAFLLFTGVILASGQTFLQLASENLMSGAFFGILAGLTYAFYLFFWSLVTKDLESLTSQLVSTFILLTISLLSIITLSEIVSAILLHNWWIPFTNLNPSDVVLQTLNGVLVIGVVYSLVTIGMSNLRKAREGANFVAAICLSFSIPFTLLAEFVIGKFIPTGAQLVGTALFVVGFALMSATMSKTREG